ncbi:helix-turn-helix transcriptional regulator [Actinoplanes sp. NPDC049265]|uniref:AraC family transcriptional regulator n=1 Tax=Actinoplanes sp. NPDC049265 TaxID=3363902 RepID=UPI00371735D0
MTGTRTLALEVGGPGGMDAFRSGWLASIGASFPLPAFSSGYLRGRVRAARLHDVAITTMWTESLIRTADETGDTEDQVQLWAVHRGRWTLAGPGATVPGGGFLLRPGGRRSGFEVGRHTAAQVLRLPRDLLESLLGGRTVTGPVTSAEVRVLLAHVGAVHDTLGELTAPGVRAAHDALIELVRAVAAGRFDDTEPRLAHALVRAAKDLADARLTDPALAPALLAGALHVSVRTLHRAFAAGGESVSGYIRARRLEQARLALSGPASVTQVAARWHFADGSHFGKAFKRRYGRTPTDYQRSLRSAGEDPAGDLLGQGEGGRGGR